MTNRERFEAAMGAKLDLETIEYADGSFHYYADRVTRIAWEAWEKACPEGWQAVPKEQTRHMAYAVEETSLPHFCTSSRQSRHHSIGREIYIANLAAAPKPEDVCK